jgi:rhamnopyranosyl-N-acetylglucosaminyl-diphospho-decaprenol beta-1,3/1,4-galactofuranosyltransferase
VSIQKQGIFPSIDYHHYGSVAAVVPTMNRSKELTACIMRLLEQDYPLKSIYIIDNSYDDKNLNALNESGCISNSQEIKGKPYEIYGKIGSTQITYIQLDRNTGSMGGFERGMRIAYEQAHDWIWLVDDDSYPRINCLRNLLECESYGSILGPLAFPAEGSSELSFEVWDERNSKYITTLEDAVSINSDGVIFGDTCPFHGCLLIKRDVVESIGFIMGEMFHWGGEIEYTLRAKRKGFASVTVVNAFTLHPKFNMNRVHVPIDDYIYMPNGYGLSAYCFFRNDVYISLKYDSKVSFLKKCCKYLWYYIIQNKFDILGCKIYSRAVFDGLFKIWGKERRFMV